MGRTIRQEKIAVLRESYYKITGNVTEAMLLNQMIYWSQRVSDYDKFIAEENNRRKTKGEDSIKLSFGWIHKTATELKDEIMSDASLKTIERKLADLVEKGFLDRRNNPDYSYDRTYQYRVNLLKVFDSLNELGYQLEGFKVDFSSDDNNDDPCNKGNDNSSQEADECNRHTDDSNRHSDDWKGHGDDWNRHGDEAIPEITPETILETTSETSSPSYSPKPESVKPNNDDEDDAKGEVSELLEKIGINNIRHKDMIEPMSRLIADLLRTGKAGQTKYSRKIIIDCLNWLSADTVDTVIDRYTQKAASGEIRNADSFLKACLISAGKSAKILELSKKSGAEDINRGKPSFDVEEYVRLSMKKLHSEAS